MNCQCMPVYANVTIHEPTRKNPTSRQTAMVLVVSLADPSDVGPEGLNKQSKLP